MLQQVRTAENIQSKILDAAIVLGWSLGIGLFAKLSIPLPFTPIPIQTQSILIFLGALLFGPRRGALAALAFVVEGALGLPVFAGGASGLAILLGPRGGYLIGYVVSAFLIGTLLERKENPSLRQIAVALIYGNAALFLCGALHLSTFVGWEKAFFLGVVPFIFGDLLKIGFIVKCVDWKKSF